MYRILDSRRLNPSLKNENRSYFILHTLYHILAICNLLIRCLKYEFSSCGENFIRSRKITCRHRYRYTISLHMYEVVYVYSTCRQPNKIAMAQTPRKPQQQQQSHHILNSPSTFQKQTNSQQQWHPPHSPPKP